MTRKLTAEREYGFLPRIKIGKSKHSWESHAEAGTLLKDVLHFLDLLAANEQGRFVFTGLPALLKMCNARRVRNKLKPCTMRSLKKVLAVLRRWHILSPYFKTWNGRYGFIFEPHEARRTIEHNVCIKHLQMDPYGALGEPPLGHRKGTVRGTAGAPLGAPVDVFGGTLRGTVRGTADSSKPIDCIELTDEQVAEWIAKNAPDAAPKVSKVKRLEGLKVSKVGKEGDQEQVQPKEQQQPQDQKRGDNVSSLGDLTDKEPDQKLRPCTPRVAENSIGIHFANCTDIIDRLTDSELDPDDYHCADEFVDWSLLSDCALEAVNAKKDRPYLGLQTNAAIMRDTMKRLKKQHNLNVPEPWLPIMDSMQNRTSEMKAEKARKKEEKDRVKPVYTAEEIAAMNYDRASCQVWSERDKAMVVINYTSQDRIKLGLTVLAPCTVHGPNSQGQFGKAVWHKARE